MERCQRCGDEGQGYLARTAPLGACATGSAPDPASATVIRVRKGVDLAAVGAVAVAVGHCSRARRGPTPTVGAVQPRRLRVGHKERAHPPADTAGVEISAPVGLAAVGRDAVAVREILPFDPHARRDGALPGDASGGRVGEGAASAAGAAVHRIGHEVWRAPRIHHVRRRGDILRAPCVGCRAPTRSPPVSGTGALSDGARARAGLALPGRTPRIRCVVARGDAVRWRGGVDHRTRARPKRPPVDGADLSPRCPADARTRHLRAGEAQEWPVLRRCGVRGGLPHSDGGNGAAEGEEGADRQPGAHGVTIRRPRAVLSTGRRHNPFPGWPQRCYPLTLVRVATHCSAARCVPRGVPRYPRARGG